MFFLQLQLLHVAGEVLFPDKNVEFAVTALYQVRMRTLVRFRRSQGQLHCHGGCPVLYREFRVGPTLRALVGSNSLR